MNKKTNAPLIKCIALVGGESTGKSTLAAALAKRLNTVYTTEYGRDLWLEKEGNLAFKDLLLIGQTQIELENQLSNIANHYLICDTTPLTTLFYSLDSFGRADLKLEQLANRKYDYTFLCAPDFPFVQDGARSSDEFRMMQDRWYKNELAQRHIAYGTVEGSLENRIEQIMRVLNL